VTLPRTLIIFATEPSTTDPRKLRRASDRVNDL
jgi:hypothetical protein